MDNIKLLVLVNIGRVFLSYQENTHTHILSIHLSLSHYLIIPISRGRYSLSPTVIIVRRIVIDHRHSLCELIDPSEVLGPLLPIEDNISSPHQHLEVSAP